MQNHPLAYNHVRLCLTNSCPLSCSHCYRRTLDKKRDSESMSEETAFQAIRFIYKELKLSDDFHIFLWGGEPLSELGLIEKILEKYPQIRFETNTNGVYIQEKEYKYLLKQINFNIVWSLGDAYQTYGGIKEKIKKQPWTACLIKEKNFLVNFTVVNYDNLYDDYIFLLENGFRRIALQQLLGFDFKDSDLEKYMGAYRRILDYKEENTSYDGFAYNTNPDNSISRNCVKTSRLWEKEILGKETNINNSLCSTGLEKLFISPSGEIWQCDGFYISNKHKLGDVYNGIDWDKLNWAIDLNNKKAEIVKKICGGCEIYDVCPGTKCLSMNERITGDMFTPYPGFCKFQKALNNMFMQYVLKKRRG